MCPHFFCQRKNTASIFRNLNFGDAVQGRRLAEILGTSVIMHTYDTGSVTIVNCTPVYR